ncbi:MAG: L,D-transpeptidase family protein [Rhodospirillaceae bacterium]|nr:L,D-transpeptidase family protein [Rhodospirillaceae bacterium]
MSDARIVTLRARLRITGDSAAENAVPEAAVQQVFDPALAEAVRRFQTRHGLEVDGIVGKETLAALNVPVLARLDTLNANLERLQRERRQWGDRFIVVNTAAAQYRLVDGAVVIFDRPVIVGRPDWPTPRLDGVIRELELHPAWVVPPNIARREILPRVRSDPNYLSKHNMRIVDGMIRQAPGPGNPLGKVKFIFPNDESIYLHDTNNPALFARAARHLSHGCVRVSNAVELAGYLLRDDPAWPSVRLDAHLASGDTERITLRQPIPVHLVYDTAWVDADGTVQFRADIYRRDLVSQRAAVLTAGACPDWRG